jgi:hypothetical protein
LSRQAFNGLCTHSSNLRSKEDLRKLALGA